MSFLGKEFVLENQEHFDGFLNSLGSEVPEDFKKSLLNFKPMAKLDKNGDQYTLTTSSPSNSKKEISFKSGVEFDEKVFGRDAKTTFTLDGNVLTQVQKYENGSTVFTFIREFSDSQLITTITRTGWDGVAKRFYKAA